MPVSRLHSCRGKAAAHDDWCADLSARVPSCERVQSRRGSDGAAARTSGLEERSPLHASLPPHKGSIGRENASRGHRGRGEHLACLFTAKTSSIVSVGSTSGFRRALAWRGTPTPGARPPSGPARAPARNAAHERRVRHRAELSARRRPLGSPPHLRASCTGIRGKAGRWRAACTTHQRHGTAAMVEDDLDES